MSVEPASRRALVVIPCFNEAKALPQLLSILRDTVSSGFSPAWTVEALVIDDGSRDNTADIARAEGVRVAQLPRNLGIGGAVQTGLVLAHREGFDCAVQMDGDGQHPPSQLRKLLARLEKESPPDLVIGSRFAPHPQTASTTKKTTRRRVPINGRTAGWDPLVIAVVENGVRGIGLRRHLGLPRLRKTRTRLVFPGLSLRLPRARESGCAANERA